MTLWRACVAPLVAAHLEQSHLAKGLVLDIYSYPPHGGQQRRLKESSSPTVTNDRRTAVNTPGWSPTFSEGMLLISVYLLCTVITLLRYDAHYGVVESRG